LQKITADAAVGRRVVDYWLPEDRLPAAARRDNQHQF